MSAAERRVVLQPHKVQTSRLLALRFPVSKRFLDAIRMGDGIQRTKRILPPL